MGGIVAYGAYVPYHRLERSAIGATLGSGGGQGTRAVASYDEDTTSMGVEAARIALADLSGGAGVERLYFATASPAYLDKTNAAAIHAALGLSPEAAAFDMGGAVRSGVGAFWAGAEARVPTVVVLSDIRVGLPGGSDERDGGDGAAAFLFDGDGDVPVLAEVVGEAVRSAEFIDRWRLPGDAVSRVWEERFGETVYLPLARGAFADALERAGLGPKDVDHLVVTGVHPRAVRSAAALTGVPAEAVVDDLTSVIGNTGTAHPGLVLADVLDRAGAGELIALLVLADGASVVLLRTTEALVSRRAARSVADQIAAGRPGLSYATFLSWRGFLPRQPPRRPDPRGPSAPAAYRSLHWKLAFTGSRCRTCAMVYLPPRRACASCGTIDEMDPAPLADVTGTVATFTIDELAYTPSPPLVGAVVDFDGGGRLRCQLTDVDPDELRVGDRVEMTFRRIVTAEGIHNYFWKARPRRHA
ncbi:MAG: OB-fold domain-containing protein [Acidimicrobiia bacterium]|nr:OB-fold domain-containing protein [Acidimicrobiia bacterium]